MFSMLRLNDFWGNHFRFFLCDNLAVIITRPVSGLEFLSLVTYPFFFPPFLLKVICSRKLYFHVDIVQCFKCLLPYLLRDPPETATPLCTWCVWGSPNPTTSFILDWKTLIRLASSMGTSLYLASLFPQKCACT